MPGANSYRHSDSKTLIEAHEDTGYTAYCLACKPSEARHGGPVFGPRVILIKRCAVHVNKKGARDEDMERVEKNSWAVDPPRQKLQRSEAALARNREKAARYAAEKRKAHSVAGVDQAAPLLKDGHSPMVF